MTMLKNSTINICYMHIDIPVMKSCNSFFKLYHLLPFITETSTCSVVNKKMINIISGMFAKSLIAPVEQSNMQCTLTIINYHHILQLNSFVETDTLHCTESRK